MQQASSVNLGRMTTRRELLMGAMATAAAGPSEVTEEVTEEELAALIRRTKESELAFVRGDMRSYLALISHADDYTLMSPFGGPARRGFDTSPARLAELTRYFKSGTGTVDVEQTLASGGLVVLVMVGRFRAEVGGLPEQTWSLRITQVYRRDPSGWRVVHRHADPLGQRITLEQTAALARG
jgi:ketosteroid isomerase-like protein